MAVGTATIDFGTGNNRAVKTVTGQTGILSTSAVEAFIMSASSADHSAYEHEMATSLMGLTCGNIVASTSFDIIATCLTMKLNGRWTISWVWV